VSTPTHYSFAFLTALLVVAPGCLGKSKGVDPQGGTPDDDPAPQCETSVGFLTGAVYLWAPPGDPDSDVANNVDILLARDGVTYRTNTGVNGGFDLQLEAGGWGVQPDDHTGCPNRPVELISIEPCETTELELVLELCPY
jgi:hypothetical protein